MATIALYASTINQMPELIKDVRQSVIDYKSELSELKMKTLTINSSVCDLEDVISSIQSSTQTQEDKVESLDTFIQGCEEFITDVQRIDEDVADIIRQRKEDFYDQYYYLKPECEKNGWEKFCDGCKKVGEWCKEHWKLVVTVVIVIAAIVLICIGVGGILGAMALGALLGAVIGGVAGGVMNAITGGSFWEGFKNGAFMGAIAGIISGGMGFAFTGGIQGVSLTLGQTVSVGGASGAGSQLISDLGDIFIKGEDISFGEVLWNVGVSGTLGAAFAGVGYGLSKAFTALRLKFGAGTKGGKNTVIYGSDDIADYQYNMMENPGPLAEMPNQPARNFYGGRYNMEVLQEDRIMYRAGNSQNPYGRWFTSEPPTSVANVRIDTAVKTHWINPKTGAWEASSYIDNVYAIKIPKGTTVYTGPVGPQGGSYVGGHGIMQTYIDSPWTFEVVGKIPLK